MKFFTKSLPACLLVLTFALFLQRASAQSVINPADTVYTYNSSAAAGSSTNPNQPAFGTIGKWIRTVRMSYSTTEWKCYIYEGMCFRVHFPKGYNPTAVDGKVYPLLIFWHGAGEAGPITDNEESMAHGGNVPFQSASDAGTWPGYIIIGQNTNGAWDPSAATRMVGIIQYMITNNKLDPFHVTANGLSDGGGATWTQLLNYPQYTSACLPMSADNQTNASVANLTKTKFTPLWTTQGGLDTWPDPGDAGIVNGLETAAGANWTYTLYPTLGHDTWDQCWAEPNFWPFMNNAYASNPWPLHGQTAFCPGVTIKDTLGIAPGFDAYQWRMNGSVISTATTNTLLINQLGTYDCRVQRGGIWSDWSHTPVVITIRQPTVTPPIALSGVESFVIPSLSQSNVVLQVPAGYASYTWQKVGSNTTISSANTLNVTTPGQYIVEVTQTGGCSSSFSSPFTVVAAPGTNAPDPASGVTATALSQTSVLVNWTQNPSPAHNEVNFEIYQATKPGGPWTLAAITPQDAFKDTVTGLNSASQYYYEIRAVDSTGASAASNVATVTTTADTQAPTAPGTLTITGTSYNSVSLSWGASTDNVGVVAYDVYVNGARSYTLAPTLTNFTVYSLVNSQNYQFAVKARDAAGNVSISSNQVTGEALMNGIPYNYYNGIPSAQKTVPNFTTMTTAFSGTLPIPGLSPQIDNTLFGFLFQGFIILPTSGNYTFQLSSDDGSNMWLGALNGTTSPYVYGSKATINDDGLHGTTSANSGVMNLTAGIYPIAIAYFNATGGYALTLQWKVPGSNSYVTVPASAFQQTAVVYGSAPNMPSNLKATTLSFKSIQLNWTDNSTNETGFEIWRSNSPANTGAAIIATTGAGVTSFIDTTAAAGTQYFYEIRAVNQYGASNFTNNYTEAEFKFNNNYVDSTGNGHTITVVGTPTFDATNKAEGTYSVNLNGTNQALTLSNANSWLQESYYQRTISTWVKASSTSGANRVIWDIGGSTNGLSLVLNGTTLEACVASASSRKQITTTMNNTNWNHIAVVYYGDTLQLYVNGVLAASNNSLGFHSIATTSDGARIGQTNGTNALNTTGGYFGGWIDDFGVYNTALSADVIQSIMNFTYRQSNAKTAALPAVPAVPTNLTLTALSSSSINVTWQDTATNATSFQLYRSNNNDQAFVLLTTLPATKFSYQDAGLFANAQYYYKVEASNVGGNSAFTPEASATTKSIPPVMNPIANQQARYGTTTVIPVSATVSGGGTIKLTASNLPGFAVFTDNGNATGQITVNPVAANAGSYTGLTVTATDAFNGSSSASFNLAVNNNYAPTISALSNYTMNEGDSVAIPLNGQDANPADTLTYVVTNVPTNYGSISSITQNVSGTGSLKLKPGYASAGTYNVVVTLNDKNGLSASTTFTLTVNYKNPNQTIYARIQASSALGTPWNNMTSPTISNMLDVNGVATTVGINLGTTFWDPQSLGTSTGNNSGVYPDAVLSQFWYFGLYGGPSNPIMQISGLNPALKYNVTLFGASNFSGVPNNGTTTYASGSQTVSLYVQGNTQNTVTLDTLTPTAAGTIPVSMGRLGTTYPGYLNAVVIQSNLNDGTSPAPPNTLAAAPVSNGVGLTWADLAYNASSYKVYRATLNPTSFTLLATLGATATSYTDSTVSGNTQYYYTVDASNSVGNSPFSDTASILTADKVPQIAAIANVTVSNTQSTTVNVTATDDPTDHLTLTTGTLPSFVTFTDNGNGTGLFTIAPTAGLQGSFNGISVTATDLSDSSRSTSFNINVVDTAISYTYVSFTENPSLNPSPWNSLLIPYIPYAGYYVNNLLSQSGVNTGVTVTLTDAWDGMSTGGEKRRNGSDVYPESVSDYAMFTTNTNNHRITVTGLNPAKAYNFQFYSSYFTSQSELTHITINGDTVSINGSHNSNKTAQINGITTSNGTVVINLQKDAAAFAAVLNSLVIEAYNPADNITFSPGDLRKLDYTVSGTIALQWQDRASNGTGYQVWRAPDGGTYSLRATLPAGTTSYVDAGLPASSVYDYVVRTVNGTTYSAYSNPVRGYTYDDAVFLFMNRVWPSNQTYYTASAPFNNLNWVYPSYPNVWNNFLDQNSLTTNIGLSQPVAFDEVDGGGASTGNNSGVVPDVAMKQGWLNFEGDSSYLLLTGLNVAKTYDITVFGSATDDNTGNASAKYAIRGGNGIQSGILNGHLNTSGTLTFFNVTPDQTGNIGIGLEAFDSANSSFGVLSDIIIKGYSPVNGNVSPPPTGTQQKAGTETESGAVFANSAQDSVVTQPLSAYPNPFSQTFTLVVPATVGDNVLVTITDAVGRTLYETTFNNLYIGNNSLQIKPNVSLGKGVYFVTVTYLNGKRGGVIKMLEK